jgi:hypothetical protein
LLLHYLLIRPSMDLNKFCFTKERSLFRPNKSLGREHTCCRRQVGESRKLPSIPFHLPPACRRKNIPWPAAAGTAAGAVVLVRHAGPKHQTREGWID